MATAQELQALADAQTQAIKDQLAQEEALNAQADVISAQARLLPEGSAARADLMSQAGDLRLQANDINTAVNAAEDTLGQTQQDLQAATENPFADPAADPAPDPNTGGASDTDPSVVDDPNALPAEEPNWDSGSSTNESATDADTAAKYADPTNIAPDYNAVQPGGYDPNNPSDYYTGGGYDPNNPTNALSSEPPKIVAAIPTYNGAKDGRARLRVPATYLVGNATGPNDELVAAGGIAFPYSPTISIEHRANYNAVNTVHSNYTQYFYKNSQVGEISLSAKFSVQNDTEAGVYLSVIHLLRALTKMRFGNDSNAGSPPPVCRLMAYGDFMLDNVPVAVSSFRQELPDNVDYIATNEYSPYGKTFVPVLSTIQLTLIPLWSRNEMQQSGVDGWLSENQRRQGFL